MKSPSAWARSSAQLGGGIAAPAVSANARGGSLGRGQPLPSTQVTNISRRLRGAVGRTVVGVGCAVGDGSAVGMATSVGRRGFVAIAVTAGKGREGRHA